MLDRQSLAELADMYKKKYNLFLSTGLSPAYLSLVARGEQRISLAALQLLLAECEGIEA